MLKLPVYLDNNATTPMDPRVFEAMRPYFLDHFGNAASRNHSLGWEAEEAVDHARLQVSRLIGAEPKEIVFTSGATESDNLAIKGMYGMYAAKGSHFISVVTEHKAVLDSLKHIERLGAEVTYLPVQTDGFINLAELEAAIKPTTIAVIVMYANNEIGTVQPIADISAVAKRRGVLLFTDATQAAGKIPVDVNKDGIDLLAFSAHKMYGPKGVGALYVRRKNPRVRLTAQMDGGGHERGLRSGTLNVPGIVGFGMACEICQLERDEDARRTGALRDKLERALLELEGTHVNGSTLHRLPHVTNISFRYVDGDALLMAVNKHVALSSGSACMTASIEPSYVLTALGLRDEGAYSSLRFGLGRFTDEEQVDYAARAVAEAVQHLREISPVWQLYKEGVDVDNM